MPPINMEIQMRPPIVLYSQYNSVPISYCVSTAAVNTTVKLSIKNATYRLVTSHYCVLLVKAHPLRMERMR